MQTTHILKLGGSILSDKKSGRPTLRTRRVREIAREVAGALSKKNMRLIVLHGAGSFGHPLAHRYRLLDRRLSRNVFEGVGRTTLAVRELGNALARIFLDAGVPVMPLQTSSFAHMAHGKLRFSDLSAIGTILEKGGVPLFGGDVVLSDGERTAIASADVLAVELARKLKRAKIYFASDTDGVYAKFPPKKNERPISRLDRKSIQRFLKSQRSVYGNKDVTGAMPGKLRALLEVRGVKAVIFNGNSYGLLMDVLKGKEHGTTIVL